MKKTRHPALSAILAATICLLGLSIPAQAEAEADTSAPPRMAFSKVTHNAGQVERGELITHVFTFRNTGGSDLVILSTKAG